MLALALALAGCGDAPGYTLTHNGGGCSQPSDGILSLSWTLRGAAATATSCAGIDHLEVDMTAGNCGVTISPVPCALDKWRYDELPDGPATVTLTAVDGHGNAVESGSAQLTLGTTPPATPVPVALN